ncbi:sulfotransferase 1E1-like [Battus philenor]|uniref:sulfotransferase 1E1-like n=1 Tax=Battus philenor TaxID=42288 RepID=UPI0035CF11E0
MSDSEKQFVEVVDVEQKVVDRLKTLFTNKALNLPTTRYGPKGYLFPREFETVGRDIYNMELRPSDTFVVTFPRSGTTWTQELVWLIKNNFDYEKAAETLLADRFPFIELIMFKKKRDTNNKIGEEKVKAASEALMVSVEKINGMASPRFIKSHLPMSLLPPKLLDTCKVVYVAREPRDVAVSFYHQHILMKKCPADLDFKTFWSYFKEDLVPWTPYFGHVKEAWELRHHPNMLYLFYEELSKDLAACARRIAEFFNVAITEDQTRKLCEHLKIDNFKNNKSVNNESMKDLGLLVKKESFIRKGKVGGWRDYFDEEMTLEADRWIEENLRDTDFRFPQ